jgi:hypothetical protein
MMFTQPGGYQPPHLESYSVEVAPPAATALFQESSSFNKPRVKITLRGNNFIERAMMLIVMIGDVFVQEYEISPDGRTLTCFLDELPKEGDIISVGYAGEKSVELPERFSLRQLSESDSGD